MVNLSISYSEAASALSALSYFDEEILPKSVPRITLYELMKQVQETFGFQKFPSYVPIDRELLSKEARTLSLSSDQADYLLRALWCAISLGSCAEQLDSEYAGDFIRDIMRLCSAEFKLRDVLGPRCFEPSSETEET